MMDSIITAIKSFVSSDITSPKGRVVSQSVSQSIRFTHERASADSYLPDFDAATSKQMPSIEHRQLPLGIISTFDIAAGSTGGGKCRRTHVPLPPCPCFSSLFHSTGTLVSLDLTKTRDTIILSMFTRARERERDSWLPLCSFHRLRLAIPAISYWLEIFRSRSSSPVIDTCAHGDHLKGQESMSVGFHTAPGKETLRDFSEATVGSVMSSSRMEFDDYRDADDAVYELNGKELLGERVAVEIARGVSGRRGDRGYGRSRSWRDKITVERARGTPRGSDQWRYGDSRGGYGDSRRSARDDMRHDRDSVNRNTRTASSYKQSLPRYGPPTRTEYRLTVENLSSRVSWQVKSYPLRRGGATGRANRLMCDDRDDDARDGPALRSSGTRLVSEVSRVTERAAWHWDVHLPPPIYHHTTTRAHTFTIDHHYNHHHIYHFTVTVIATGNGHTHEGIHRPKSEPSATTPHRSVRPDRAPCVWPFSLSVSKVVPGPKDLKDYMRQAGEVTYADAHKQRRNEGVVEFATYSDLKNAIDKLDDTELNGRRIRLIEDKRPRDRGPDLDLDHVVGRAPVQGIIVVLDPDQGTVGATLQAVAVLVATAVVAPVPSQEHTRSPSPSLNPNPPSVVVHAQNPNQETAQSRNLSQSPNPDLVLGPRLRGQSPGRSPNPKPSLPQTQIVNSLNGPPFRDRSSRERSRGDRSRSRSGSKHSKSRSRSRSPMNGDKSPESSKQKAD
ncbi:Serine-arginine protein 55 [Cyphomyrmex costatus]|uniref:Serine-arginine protein 55 n=1 Tax=Cyphomyrmex costatus TaxID=456900 RepID=A0A195C636_9HYME|nr:Serine-arginine protein 55 [Cyphomyrmex costatus]